MPAFDLVLDLSLLTIALTAFFYFLDEITIGGNSYRALLPTECIDGSSTG